MLSEHSRAVSHADFTTSALAEHAWNCNHFVDWTNTCVLSTYQDDSSRIVQESIYNRTIHNTLNRDGGALPNEYDNLLYKHQSYSIIFFLSFYLLLLCMLISTQLYLRLFTYSCFISPRCMFTFHIVTDYGRL